MFLLLLKVLFDSQKYMIRVKVKGLNFRKDLVLFFSKSFLINFAVEDIRIYMTVRGILE